MVNIARVPVELSGAGVTGGGVSTFYTTGEGSVLADALEDLYAIIKGYSPNDLSFTVPAEGDVYDSVTGDYVTAWTGGPGTTQTGGVTGSWAAGVGGRIVWGTAGVTNGRRVRGSTYLVPLASEAFDADGTLSPTPRTAMQNAVNTFRTTMGGDFVIWRRPRPGLSGGLNSTTSGTVDDRVSWLRSRRT